MTGTTYKNTGTPSKIIKMTDAEYLIYLDKFWTKYYDRLYQTAKNHTHSINYDPGDFIAELYLSLTTKKTKVEKMTTNKATEERNKNEDPLLLYCMKWITNNCHLFKPNKRDSNVQSKYQLKEYVQPNEDNVPTTYSQPEMELNDEEKARKVFYYVIDTQLDMVDKKLYELHFTKNLSVKKIVALIPGTKTNQINRMINEMYASIQSKCKEYYKQDGEQRQNNRGNDK